MINVKEVKDFPGYYISSDGIVYSDRMNKKKIRKQLSTRNVHGFTVVTFSVNNKRYVRYVHLLVAEMFLTEKEDKSFQIRHKDGNKLNNDVSNLEWVPRNTEIKRAKEKKRESEKELKNKTFPKSKIIVPGKTIKVEPKVSIEKLSEKERLSKTTKINEEIAELKKEYQTEIRRAESDFKTQKSQIETKYKKGSAEANKKIKRLEIRKKSNIDRLKGSLERKVNRLKKEKGNLVKEKKEINYQFRYKGELYKVSDTGHSLAIRVKEGDNWQTIPIVKIILEDYLKKEKPSPEHRIGFRDFNYRNISPVNLVWETVKEKKERHKRMFPFKDVIKKKKIQEVNTQHFPEKFHSQIVKFLSAGKGYAQIARLLGIPRYILYRYCKRENLEITPQPKKIKDFQVNIEPGINGNLENILKDYWEAENGKAVNRSNDIAAKYNLGLQELLHLVEAHSNCKVNHGNCKVCGGDIEQVVVTQSAFKRAMRDKTKLKCHNCEDE